MKRGTGKQKFHTWNLLFLPDNTCHQKMFCYTLKCVDSVNISEKTEFSLVEVTETVKVHESKIVLS